MPIKITERIFRRGLIALALVALATGLALWGTGRAAAASWAWAFGTIPVAAGLRFDDARFPGRPRRGRLAFVSMSAALLLGETLAGIVVAVMYAGGSVLEDFAVAPAERDLKSLVDRAPHRRRERSLEDIPVEQVAVGDDVLVRAGEIIPVDGVITSATAVIDEVALTGEPMPATCRPGEPTPKRHTQCR